MNVTTAQKGILSSAHPVRTVTWSESVQTKARETRALTRRSGRRFWGYMLSAIWRAAFGRPQAGSPASKNRLCFGLLSIPLLTLILPPLVAAQSRGSAPPVHIVVDDALQTPRSVSPSGEPFVKLTVAPTKPLDARSVALAFFNSYRTEYHILRPDEEFRVLSTKKDSGPYTGTAMTTVRVQAQPFASHPPHRPTSPVALHLL